MPLVTTTVMLEEAQASGYAVGAFNIENMEMAQAVMDAAMEVNSPVILQTTPSTLRYASARVFAALVSAMAREATVPVALHVDHGNSFALVMQAMQAGYTAVMYDGSLLPFAENIRETRKVVDAASAVGIPVEAELGSIGGKEDDAEAETAYTDPLMAAEFVAETGVDSLAVAIGTAHGVYKGHPVLDIPRLKAIRERVFVPLVLHGASGLSEETVRACVREGICKVNFATELRMAYSDGVKDYLRQNPDAYDPKAYGKAGYARVKEAVKNKLAIVRRGFLQVDK